jgi:hypothetical protein
MSRTKACEAAIARFIFKPVCGIHTEEQLDAVATNVRETIEEIEKCARFYRFSPCFSQADGSIEVIVYREGYIKKHPNRFGLKRHQLKGLEGPLPDEFANMMYQLQEALSCLSKPYSFTTFELVSFTSDGKEDIVGPMRVKCIPPNDPEADGYDMDDFNEIEEYEIDPEYFEEWFGGYYPEEEFGEECDEEFEEDFEEEEEEDS